MIQYPPASTSGNESFEAVLTRRRSIRAFEDADLEPWQLGQLAWSAQGLSSPFGLRTAPSAGALYPLKLYLATRQFTGIYLPRQHALQVLNESDRRPAIAAAALDQDFIQHAACTALLTARPEVTEQKYGQQRAPRYIAFEAGHAAQNLLLQAQALGLGAVPVGAFDDQEIARLYCLPSEQVPLYLVAIGWPAGGAPHG